MVEEASLGPLGVNDLLQWHSSLRVPALPLRRPAEPGVGGCPLHPAKPGFQIHLHTCLAAPGLHMLAIWLVFPWPLLPPFLPYVRRFPDRKTVSLQAECLFGLHRQLRCFASCVTFSIAAAQLLRTAATSLRQSCHLMSRRQLTLHSCCAVQGRNTTSRMPRTFHELLETLPGSRVAGNLQKLH